jgi:hypothetical protein
MASKPLLSMALVAACAPNAPKPKKGWLDTQQLPPLRTTEGVDLSLSEVETLLQTYRNDPSADGDAALPKVPSPSRDPFALALAEAWVRARGPSDDASWVIDAVVRLGGGSTHRTLSQWARRFAREKAMPVAVLIIDAMDRLGSDSALAELRRLQSAPNELGERAEKHVSRITKSRGLTASDVEDLIVPGCSLGEGEELDYGERKFRIDFDADCSPVIRAEDGTILPRLPRPNKTDNPQKAVAAQEHWTELKTLLRDTLRSESKRLEWAMCYGRRWSRERFLSVVVAHPLLSRLAQRLLWASVVGKANPVPFRIAEDRTFADATDSTYVLPEGSKIILPHPLLLEPETRAQWATIFADYAILSPFPQLGRETFIPTELERDSRVIERFGTEVLDKARFVVEALGWEDIGADEDLMFSTVLPDGTRAHMSLGDRWDRSPTRPLHVTAGKPLGALDSISFSELIRDVGRLPRP